MWANTRLGLHHASCNSNITFHRQVRHWDTRWTQRVLVKPPPSRLKHSEKLNRTCPNEQTKKQETKGFDLDVGVQMIDPSFTALLANPAGQRLCYQGLPPFTKMRWHIPQNAMDWRNKWLDQECNLEAEVKKGKETSLILHCYLSSSTIHDPLKDIGLLLFLICWCGAASMSTGIPLRAL
jgi:hypothetical protein